MQKHVNVMLLLACPHCLAELTTTVDDVQQEANIQCPQCGTRVELHPDDLPSARPHMPTADRPFYGIQF